MSEFFLTGTLNFHGFGTETKIPTPVSMSLLCNTDFFQNEGQTTFLAKCALDGKILFDNKSLTLDKFPFNFLRFSYAFPDSDCPSPPIAVIWCSLSCRIYLSGHCSISM